MPLIASEILAANVTVTTSSAQLVAARASRKSVKVFNLGPTNTIYVDEGTATVAGSFPIPVNTWQEFETTSAINAIAGVASCDVRILEVFN